MTIVNIHEAKTHLSQLLDRAVAGEPITIAKAGRPIAELVPVESVPAEQRRLGFLRGRVTVPDDFDQLGSEQIETDFAGGR